VLETQAIELLGGDGGFKVVSDSVGNFCRQPTSTAIPIRAASICRPRHCRQAPRGGNAAAPQDVQRSATSRPRAAASQKPRVSAETSGGIPTVASITDSG
jgi:hypothetical protein